MAQIYSVVFLRGNTTSGVNVTYTVPAGHVAILRCIDVVAQVSGTPGQLYVREPGSPNIFFTGWGTPSLGQVLSWRGRQVFEAGAEFGMYDGSGLGGSGYRMSGYLLEI